MFASGPRFINEECFDFDGDCDNYRLVPATTPVWGVMYCDSQPQFGVPTLKPSCYGPIVRAWAELGRLLGRLAGRLAGCVLRCLEARAVVHA